MRKIISWLLICVMTVSVGSAALLPASAAEDVPSCTLELSETDLNIKVGQSATVDCTYAFSGGADAYKDCSVSWTVGDKTVTTGTLGGSSNITSANGSVSLTLSGHKVGTTEVTLFITKKGSTERLAQQTLNVAVWNDPMKCDLELSSTSITISKGGIGTVFCAYAFSGDYSGVGKINIYLDFNLSPVVDGVFGEWVDGTNFDKNMTALTLTGKTLGTVTGTVSIKEVSNDTVTVLAERRLKVTVVSEPAAALSVSDTTMNLFVGESRPFMFATAPANQTVSIQDGNAGHPYIDYRKNNTVITVTGKSVGTDVIILTMTYGGKTYTQRVTVNVVKPTLQYIVIAKQPDKLRYNVGETPDTTGMEILAAYSDGSTADVSEYVCSEPDMTTTGAKTVTVSYTEDAVTATAAFTIDVTSDAPYVLSAASVSGKKAGETVDVPVRIDANAGVAVILLRIAYDSSLTLTGIENGTVFAAGEMTPGGDLTANPYSISWNSAASAADNVKTGTVVTLKFRIAEDALAGRKTIGITADADNTVNKDMERVDFVPGDGSVTVTDTAKALHSIAVTKTPVKTAYNVGDTLDTTGMIVTARYADHSARQVTGWTCSPRKLNMSGTQIVTVAYTENGTTATATFSVSVDNGLKSIEVETLPTKRAYLVGDTLETAGMTIRARYFEGSSGIVPGWSCSPVQLQSAGTQEITVSYTEKGVTAVTTFTVEVSDPLKSISVTTLPTKRDYLVGDTLDTAGMVVKARYYSGKSEPVTGWTCSPDKTDAKGRQEITVTYTEGEVTATTSFTVNVTDPLLSITVSSKPTKLTYTVGEALDTAGMAVTAAYRSGDSRTVYGWTYSPAALTETGTQTITVTYTEDGVTATADFTVRVVPDDSIPVTGVRFEFPDPIEMYYKDKRPFRLPATVYPKDATNQTVFYSSDHPDVVSVDENGTLSALKRGNARITATTEDGGYTATYRVNVSYTVWQWLVIIFLFGWLWY